MIEDLNFEVDDESDLEAQPYPAEDPLDPEYHQMVAEREREATEDMQPDRVAHRVGLGHSLGIN